MFQLKLLVYKSTEENKFLIFKQVGKVKELAKKLMWISLETWPNQYYLSSSLLNNFKKFFVNIYTHSEIIPQCHSKTSPFITSPAES